MFPTGESVLEVEAPERKCWADRNPNGLLNQSRIELLLAIYNEFVFKILIGNNRVLAENPKNNQKENNAVRWDQKKK